MPQITHEHTAKQAEQMAQMYDSLAKSPTGTPGLFESDRKEYRRKAGEQRRLARVLQYLHRRQTRPQGN